MGKKIVSYVIDACALIAYLRNEKGGEKLRNLLKRKNTVFYMHSINFGEVYYDSLRVTSEENAEELFRDISLIPVKIIRSLDIALIKAAGKYKTSYNISYADSFVLALAELENAIVISTDHHEFEEIEKSKVIDFLWLR